MNCNDETALLLCPSSRCGEGALLLGIIGRDGQVGYIRPALIITKDFVEMAQSGRRPEHRFRFAAPCEGKACVHWTGVSCAVIGDALSAATGLSADQSSSAQLPNCTIRPQCRWFAQEGSRACGVCPFVFNYVPAQSAASR
jgi:hypothetical protein